MCTEASLEKQQSTKRKCLSSVGSFDVLDVDDLIEAGIVVQTVNSRYSKVNSTVAPRLSKHHGTTPSSGKWISKEFSMGM